MEARTLFILDGTQMMREFSGFMIDCDLNPSSTTPGIKAGSGGPRTVGKSFWTCSCESVLEYSRVIFDIFDHSRRVAIGVAINDTLTPVIPKGCSTAWDVHLASSSQFIEPMYPFTKRIMSNQAAKTIKHSSILKQAVSLLVEGCSPETGGRIVFLTRLPSQSVIERLKDGAAEARRESGDNWPLTQGCAITILHTNAVGAEPKMFSLAQTKLNKADDIIFEVISAFSGKSLTTCLYSLAMKHHDLILTTIQGIPMKEEQGAGQSVNYDVELLHPASVFNALTAMPNCGDFISTSLREGVPLKMACMRWSTPKLSPSSDVQFRLHSFCACPLDMNSKPTQCLVQFLLNGRTVVLEPPKHIVAKTLTYLMMSIGGVIYLQAFATGRLPGDDFSEYKTPSEKINLNHLTAIVRAGTLQRHSEDTFCSDASLTYLSRLTSCCPLDLSESLIHHSPIAKPFIVLLTETLKNDTFPECTKILEKLASSEGRIDGIINMPPNSKLRSKFPKPDTAITMLWAEILSLLSAYTHISVKHRQLFEYACNLKPNVAGLVNSKALLRESVFPHIEKSSPSAPLNLTMDASSVPLTNKSNRQSSITTPIKKIRLSGAASSENSSFAATSASANLHPVGESFLTMVTTQVASRRKPRDFVRRLPDGKVSELYIGFEERAAKLSAMSTD